MGNRGKKRKEGNEKEKALGESTPWAVISAREDELELLIRPWDIELCVVHIPTQDNKDKEENGMEGGEMEEEERV